MRDISFLWEKKLVVCDRRNIFCGMAFKNDSNDKVTQCAVNFTEKSCPVSATAPEFDEVKLK